MKLKVCKKCHKNKSLKFEAQLKKHLRKQNSKGIDVSLSGCLGGCKGLTIKMANQKRVSGLKIKDAKKIAKSLK